MRKLISVVLVCSALVAGASAPVSANHWTYDRTINRQDLHQGHADVLRLYWAFFNRQPENGGAQFWLHAYDSCAWGSARVAEFFSVSPEFASTYGEPTDEEFVELVYGNVFGRASDAGGRTFWLGELSSGKTRGSMVADLAFSQEFRDTHPLPSDGRANTGCVTDPDAHFDPVSALLAFSQAWDAADWTTMANFSADSVVTEAQTWRQDTFGRLGLTFETASTIATFCGHPGSGEHSCEVIYAPAVGFGLIFNLVLLETEDGFRVINLIFQGDAG